MRVCLVVEGCYPYVVGGVSTWIQTLVTEMSDIEFCIYTIGVNEEDKGKFKYKLPENITSIQETFLNTKIRENQKNSLYRFNNRHREALMSLMLKEEVLWKEVFDFFYEKKLWPPKILMGRDFLDIAMEVYKKSYSRTVFMDFLWTLRSMYLPLFTILQNPIPKADLYHSVSTGYAGVVASLGKHLYEKPFLLTEHGIYTREREEEIIRAEWTKGYFKDMWIQHFYKLSRCAYNYADQVVSLFSLNRELQIELGCSPEKTVIIPNGIKEENYVHIPRKEEEEESLNIGAIVRVVPIKDIKTMLMAFEEVKNQLPHAKFYIMGPQDENPEYYEECKQLLESLGTKDVIFTGRVDVKEYIGKMDILVLTSISEAQPLSILEGMASGKPWVVTNVGACGELIEGTPEDEFGLAGVVVPTMNLSRIASAIINLGRDENLRKSMGQAGVKRVKKYYRQQDFIEKYIELYNRLGGDPSWQV